MDEKREGRTQANGFSLGEHSESCVLGPHPGARTSLNQPRGGIVELLAL
jgi:hypothetical protein